MTLIIRAGIVKGEMMSATLLLCCPYSCLWHIIPKRWRWHNSWNLYRHAAVCTFLSYRAALCSTLTPWPTCLLHSNILFKCLFWVPTYNSVMFQGFAQKTAPSLWRLHGVMRHSLHSAAICQFLIYHNHHGVENQDPLITKAKKLLKLTAWNLNRQNHKLHGTFLSAWNLNRQNHKLHGTFLSDYPE